MGRPKSPDGAQSVIEQLYPEANAVMTETLVNKLKSYASRYKKKAWPSELLVIEKTDKGKSEYHFPPKSHCYIRNLLELDAFWGESEATIEYLQKNKDRKRLYEKKLTDRIKDLRWRADQYVVYAKKAEGCIESLLSDKDPRKENLFKFNGTRNQTTAAPTKNLQQDASVIALRSLERIELIERDQRLSEESRLSQLGVLYLESGHIEKALEFSNKALEIDMTCGYAWMVKGYLALQGVQQAFEEAFLQRELGTSGIAISAEEIYHEERREAAWRKAEENRYKTTSFFLNAWRYWPRDPMCISNSYSYEHKLIIKLFDSAKQDRKLDAALFKQVLEEKRESLNYFATFPEHTEVLLSSVLPVIQKTDASMAVELARGWMGRVECSEPYRDYPNPPVAYEDLLLMAAGNNLARLGVVYELLPFAIVDKFCRRVGERFREAIRMYHLQSASDSYRDALNRCLVAENPNYQRGLEICSGALKGLQFMDEVFDVRMQKQWRYMQLKMVAMSILKGITNILNFSPDESNSIADLLLEHATLEVLQDLAGDDYFDKMEDYHEELPEPWLISFDLTNDKCHILHTPIQGFLDNNYYKEMIRAKLPRAVGEKSPVEHIIDNLLASESLDHQRHYNMELLAAKLKELRKNTQSETLITTDDITYLEDQEELMALWDKKIGIDQ